MPQDAVGHVGGNIEPLAGFHYSTVSSSLHDAIGAAHGETAVHALGAHLPFVTIWFAAKRNYEAVKLGKDPFVAGKHAIIETVGKGGGAISGAAIGGAIGSPFGPIGAFIGGLIGGISGAITGGAGAEWVKRRPFEAALLDMSDALHSYGGDFSERLDQIEKYAEAPLIRMHATLRDLIYEVNKRRKRIFWWIWPDFYTVLIEESVTKAEADINQERPRVQKIRAILRQAEQSGHYEKVGLMMANAPEVAELIGFDVYKLEQVKKARENMLFQRKQLNPRFVPPT